MTRFEKLKKLVKIDNKKAIAEMLAVIANENSPNDYTAFVPEWLEYLDEEIPVPTPVDEAYERGLNEAWECARKIANMTESEMVQAFGNWIGWSRTFEKYSSSEAMQKIKAWEERQTDDEIKVGDIVIVDNERHDAEKGMIIEEDSDYAYPYRVLFSDKKYGMVYIEAVAKNELQRTDKSISQFAEILEQLKGDDVIADND